MRIFKQISVMLILSSILLFAGCAPFDENNIIEETSPVIFWSMKSTGNGQLIVSTLVPPLTSESKHLISLKVDLLKQGVKNFNLKYFRELKNGQLRILFINKNVAKKSVLSIFNTVLIDPEVTPRLYPVIVDGNFEDYISNNLKENPFLDYYIYRMLKHYEEYKQGEMSIVTLHDFMKRKYSQLATPILPVFKATKNNFTYEGTAFFRQQRLTVTATKMDDQIFQLLAHDHYLKVLALPKFSVSLGKVRSNVDKRLNENANELSVNVHLTGRISEYRGKKNLNDSSVFRAFNHELESYLEKRTKNFLKKMQKNGVDPLGIGNLTISPMSKKLSHKEWMMKWKKLTIKVHYQLDLNSLIQ